MAPPPLPAKGRRAAIDLFPYTNRIRGNGKIQWICSYGTMWIYFREQTEPLTSKWTYRAMWRRLFSCAAKERLRIGSSRMKNEKRTETFLY